MFLLASLKQFHQLKDFYKSFSEGLLELLCENGASETNPRYQCPKTAFIACLGLQVGCVALLQIMGSGSGSVSGSGFSVQAEGVPFWGTSFSHGER